MAKIDTFIIVGILMFSSFTLLIFTSEDALSDKVVGEVHIQTDTIWYEIDSPYYIEGNVTVDQGVNLTIETGVEVRFNGYFSLFVEGNLTALGNSGNMIRFTSNESSPSYEEWDRIQINSTGYANLRFCNISYASYGVFLKSDGNNLFSNSISYGFEGLHLLYSSGNTILNNVIYNQHRGIYLSFSDSNEIRFNHIHSNSGDGISILYSSDNAMANNNISFNGDYGIKLNSSEGNFIFHNNFIDNADQAYDYTYGNTWNYTYPTGGNFWSDYTGEDVNRSENQDVPGSDGIGDEPYNISGAAKAVDHYPLMSKASEIAPTLINLVSPMNNSIIRNGTTIDLEIVSLDIDHVNYSKNGGPNQTITLPYDIDTTGWPDGNATIDVFVVDTNGFVNSSWYFFVIDSVKPTIQLNSPLNNSIFRAGEIVNLSIVDPHIKSVYYYLNMGSKQNLLFPYDIDTCLWPDDYYTIEIHALDIAGNKNYTSYEFTVDSTPPMISLNSPANNSYIKPGVPINFSISDDHLASINFSVDDGPIQSFTTQYLVNTSLLDDGNHTITVNAVDNISNHISKSFEFVTDSVPPSFILSSPQNNSIIKAGVPLNFSVFDENPFTFKYNLMKGETMILEAPYNINTSNWSDQRYTINVNITDLAGNTNKSYYNITIDSIEPQIILISPENNSNIQSGINIVFLIYESNLAYANYSVNGGENQSLMPSMEINTTGWYDGTYYIEVFCGDMVGNNASKSFVIHIDTINPRVSSSNPKNKDDGVLVESIITITFDELMDKLSVISALSISPAINNTTAWSLDNLTLIITPVANLTNDTTYTIIINTTAKDLAGNALEEDFVLTFSTSPGKKDDNPWLVLMFLALIILVVVIILLGIVYLRKKRESEEPKGPVEELEDMYAEIRAEEDIKAMESMLEDEEKFGERFAEAKVILNEAKKAFEKQDYKAVTVYEKTLRDIAEEATDEEENEGEGETENQLEPGKDTEE